MKPTLSFTDNTKSGLEVLLTYEGDNTHFKESKFEFKGKKLEYIYFPDHNRIILSLGKREAVKLDYYRRAAAKAAKLASFYKLDSVHFNITGLSAEHCVALSEGAVLGNYVFDKYKSKEEKNFIIKKLSFPAYAKQFSSELESALIVSENVCFVRDIVNDNSDTITPDFMEKISREICRKKSLSVKVLNENELKKLKMNLILNVGSAGKSRPRLIIIEHEGNKKSKDNVLFVGKGVCFDSGGLNIKTGDWMKDMRMDMAGAATVLGIMKSVAELGIKKNIVGIMPCVENLVSEKACRPGDIIKSYSGKTVENNNTDAEGRLILADALNYGVKKYSPNMVVEYSTLTGAVIRALGEHCAGLITNSEELGKKISDAGMACHERIWVLPLFEEYLDEVIGERSDFRSLGKTGNNGSIFGGAFLSKFVENKPFAHLDVAGTAMIDEPTDYMPKGGTGFGVRLAVEFLKKN